MSQPEAEFRRAVIARRVIYLLVAAAVVVPFLLGLAMKVKVSRLTEQVYDKIDSLPAGSPVLLSLDYDPASMAELHPMSLAFLRQCFRRGLHPLVMTHWPNNLGLCKEVLDRAAKEAGKVSGKDYVFLGFRPGYESLVLNMGENLTRAFEKDYYNQPTATLPALQGIRSLKDIPAVVVVAAGASIDIWIAYGRDRFGFALAAGVTAVMAPDLYPFLQSGQLIGLLGGLRGAAEYETRLGASGAGRAGMAAQSVAHVLIIVLIVGANVWAFALRRRRRKES
jgi:hypothetical protein